MLSHSSEYFANPVVAQASLELHGGFAGLAHVHSLSQRTGIAIVIGNHDDDRHVMAHSGFQLHGSKTERKIAADRNNWSFRVYELGRNRVRDSDPQAAAGSWGEPTRGELHRNHPLASSHGQV